MPNDAEIIIDIDVETKKVEKELDRVLNEYSKRSVVFKKTTESIR